MTNSDSALFPIMLKLSQRRCVVVGAGKVAAAKVKGLLAGGAQVIVVSPAAQGPIRTWAAKRELTWRRKTFSPRDLTGAFLAIAATDSNQINELVFRSCRARQILCNVVDDPDRCDFFYPAVVRRGPLQIAISTSGRSPALAARLRKELAGQFGPDWSRYVKRLGKKRAKILKTAPSAARKTLLKQIAIPPGSSHAKRTRRAGTS